MSRLLVYHQIFDLLSDYSSKITRKNKQNLTDEAIIAEDVAGDILSKVFSLSLQNANRRKGNTPAIDLSDSDNQIKIQVTTIATGFKTKRDGTIKKFLNEEEFYGITRLFILFITNEKIEDSILKKDKIRENCDYQGFDLDHLLEEIKLCDETTQNQILKILRPEFENYEDINLLERTKYPAVKYYIERKFSSSNSDFNLFMSIYGPEKQTLVEVIEENLRNLKTSRILLRADAAMGKSIELENLANYFSDISRELLPVLIYLKNFDGDLLSYITVFQRQWKRIKPRQLLLVFDGIDEIPVTLLPIFVAQFNQLLQAESNINIVASVRTNIFVQSLGAAIDKDKVLKEIFLPVFTEADILFYINKRLPQPKQKKLQRFFKQDWVNELQYSPFYLSNITDLFDKDEPVLPRNKSELIQGFIELKKQKDFEKYHDRLHSKELTIFANKLALFLTLTGTNAINEVDLHTFTSLVINEIAISSLFKIVKQGADTLIFFDHNNFQEYLASLQLVKLPNDELNSILFHAEMKQVLKPKMVNVVNFLFTLLDPKDLYFEQLLNSLTEFNTEMLLKFEREKMSRQTRFQIFQKLIEKGQKDKIYWFGSDIRPRDIANFISYSEESARYILEQLKISQGYYHHLCLFDLLNIYPEENISLKNRSAIKEVVVVVLLNNDLKPEVYERALESLIQFKIYDEQILENLKKSPANTFSVTRGLILKYIFEGKIPEQFDYVLRSTAVVGQDSKRSFYGFDISYLGYLIEYLIPNNAQSLIKYFTKNYRVIQKLIGGNSYKGIDQKRIEQLYLKLGQIARDTKSEVIFIDFFAFVTQINIEQRSEVKWGKPDIFFTTTDTSFRAFFDLFKKNEMTATKGITVRLFDHHFIPELITWMLAENKQHRVHRLMNALIAEKHPHATMLKEKMLEAAPEFYDPVNYDNHLTRIATRRTNDLTYLDDFNLLRENVKQTYKHLEALILSDPKADIFSLHFDDDFNEQRTNNLIHDIIEQEELKNIGEFDSWLKSTKWEIFKLEKILQYSADTEYTISESLTFWALSYLERDVLPLISIKKFVLEGHISESAEFTQLQGLLYYFDQGVIKLSEMILLDFLYLCGLGLSFVENFGNNNTEKLHVKIYELVGHEQFKKQVLTNINDQELPNFIYSEQVALAETYAIVEAIPTLVERLRTKSKTEDYKDALANVIISLADNYEVLVPLLDDFESIEFRWQVIICEYLSSVFDLKNRILTIVESSTAIISESPYWSFELIRLGISLGSKIIASKIFDQLKDKRKIPDFMQFHATSFDVFAEKDPDWLIRKCLDILPDSIYETQNTKHNDVAELLEEIIRNAAVKDIKLVRMVYDNYNKIIEDRAKKDSAYYYVQWFKIRLLKKFHIESQHFFTNNDALKIIERLAL
jgi:hypothetical protein